MQPGQTLEGLVGSIDADDAGLDCVRRILCGGDLFPQLVDLLPQPLDFRGKQVRRVTVDLVQR